MKYLFVLVHPDDEVLGAGGMIYDLVKKNNEVHILFMCAQVEERKTAGNVNPIKEQVSQALNILGVNNANLGSFSNIRMNTVDHIELVKFIENEIVKVEPDVIITHYYNDLNNDHRITSEACDAAIRYFQRNENICI